MCQDTAGSSIYTCLFHQDTVKAKALQAPGYFEKMNSVGIPSLCVYLCMGLLVVHLSLQQATDAASPPPPPPHLPPPPPHTHTHTHQLLTMKY